MLTENLFFKMPQFIQKTLCLPFFIFYLNFVLSEPIYAQQFNIKTFTTNDGLSHNDVRAIASDSSGFLWIATWDGLSRYDGYTFKNYYHNNDDSLSLPYFSVYNLMVDGADNLWLMTDDKRIVKYDREKDIFLLANHLYKELQEFCTHMSVDEAGNFWAIYADCICKYDPSKDRFDKYEIFDKAGNPLKDLLSEAYFSVSAGEDGKIWVVHEKTYQFIISGGNKLILQNTYQIYKNKLYENFDFSFIFWYRIYFSGSGRRWISSNSGLYLLDERTNLFSEYKARIPLNEFQGDGYIFWARYDDGIYLYDQKEDRMSHIEKESAQLVQSVYYQNRDIVWFSNTSLTGASIGLNRVVFTPAYFRIYPLEFEENDIPAVYAITKDPENNLWLALRGNNPVVQITPDMKLKKLKIPEEYLSVSPGAVRSLTPTDNGLWIGFFRDLLLFYDFNSGSFTRYMPDSHSFRPVAIDKDGSLYLISSNNSVIHFSPQLKKSLKTIKYEPASSIYKIIIDNTGIIWSGMNHSSIFKFDPQTGKSETFTLMQENYNVEDICPGDDGELWLALLGGGVCRFNPETGRKIFYTTSNGLTNNMTYSLLKDKTGNIWVSTNTGISRINPKTGQIRGFGLNEGLTINEFNSGASYKDKNGEFFMGGMGGLVSFFPDSVNNELIGMVDQKILINEIRVSGETKHYRRTLAGPDTVILNKGEKNIGVFFSSSDFLNSEKTLYRYKLSKVDENWIITDSRNRNINYANLKPGWHNLLVQATDRGGSWNAEKEVRILVKPRYHETLLFRIAVPVMFLLLIVSWIYFYIRQLNQKAAQKQDALRLQSLQGQMNPHFIFNSLNSINYFISKNDVLSANRYIADFSKLIRSILYNFNSDFISLEKEIESIEDYLKIEHLRFGDKFNYRISMNSDIPFGQLKVSPGLVQPFVENAIWHGVRGLNDRKGNIVLTYSWDNENLRCTVEDDGIGRKKSEDLKSKIDRKVSRGILIVTERLNIINKLQKSNYQVIISDLYPENHETGTKVLIGIPVKKS